MGNSNYSQLTESEDITAFKKLFSQKFHFVNEISDPSYGMLQIYKQNMTAGEIEIMGQLEKQAQIVKDIQHPNLLKLYIMIENISDNFCGDFDKLNIYYEFYPRSLVKHMQLKQKKNSQYSEQELLIYLYALVSAYSCFEENQLYQYNQVDPSHIFITDKHVIKVATFLKTANQVIRQKRNLNQYLSPQQLQGLKFPSLTLENQSKSIVFQIGMVVLSLTILKPLYFCYDYVNCTIKYEYINNLLSQMPYHSYSKFLTQTLQKMLIDTEQLRPTLNQILLTLRPYISQEYFQQELLKDIPQQLMPIPSSPLTLRKNLSNVQLLQKSVMKSEQQPLINESHRQREVSPINNQIVVKKGYIQNFSNSNFSTDYKSQQSYMQIPNQLSPINQQKFLPQQQLQQSQQQQHQQQICQKRSIQNSKIIQKENQRHSRQSSSFYHSQPQTFLLTTPVSPISKATQKLMLSPFTKSPINISQQNESHISDQFNSPGQKQFQIIKQSTYINQQSPNILKRQSVNCQVRKIPEQAQLVQRSLTEQFVEENKQDDNNNNKNNNNNNGSNETFSNNEKDISDKSDKSSNNEKLSNNSSSNQSSNNNKANFQSVNPKNNNIFERITEVSKEVENQTEMEQKTHDSQQQQQQNNNDQESQEWQLVENQEDDDESDQQNYIEIIEEKIKQALRNSQQTISQLQGSSKQQQQEIYNQSYTQNYQLFFKDQQSQQLQSQQLQQPQQQQQQWQSVQHPLQFQRKKPQQNIQYYQQQPQIQYSQTPVVQQFSMNAPSPYRAHSPNMNVQYRPQQQQVMQFYPNRLKIIFLNVLFQGSNSSRNS